MDTWTLQPDGSYEAPLGFFRTLTKRSDGSFFTRSPEGFRRRYAADGRLEVYVDRNGNILRFEYDAAGNLARVIDPFGRVVELESFPDGVDRLVTIRDFIGREVVYGYDERGDLPTVRSPVVENTSTGNDFPARRASGVGLHLTAGDRRAGGRESRRPRGGLAIVTAPCPDFFEIPCLWSVPWPSKQLDRCLAG